MNMLRRRSVEKRYRRTYFNALLDLATNIFLEEAGDLQVSASKGLRSEVTHLSNLGGRRNLLTIRALFLCGDN